MGSLARSTPGKTTHQYSQRRASAIDTPNSSDPQTPVQSQWETDMIWPGGNPYETSSYNGGNEDAAISYVVNALYFNQPITRCRHSTLNSNLYSIVDDEAEAERQRVGKCHFYRRQLSLCDGIRFRVPTE